MKKKTIAAVLSFTLLLTTAACGGKNNADSSEKTGNEDPAQTENAGNVTGTEDEDGYVCASRAFDINGGDYVKKLCDYEKMPITISGEYEVDREDAVSYLSQMIDSYQLYTADETKTTVGAGDIVNVDYVGKLNGEPFTGGSAEDQDIDVDNNSSVGVYSAGSYIDGFTDALKGAKVGDVIDEDISFPEDYGNADLAGKAVVFTFTVNSIQKKMTIDDVDDAFAKEQFDVDTVEEMYQMIEESLAYSATTTRESDINNAIQDYMLENCELELPEDYLAARFSDYKYSFIVSNCQGDEGMLENYLSSYYGRSLEEAEEIWANGIYRQVGMECILDAVASKEGIVFNEEDFNKYVEALVSGGTYSSVENMYLSYGYGDIVFGEKYTKNIYVENLALAKIKETAVITEE